MICPKNNIEGLEKLPFVRRYQNGRVREKKAISYRSRYRRFTHMAVRSLSQSFGPNAVLIPGDGGSLEISLADLAAVTGLGVANPSPSQLVAALVLLWTGSTAEGDDDDPQCGWIASESYKSFVSRGDALDRQEQIEYSVSFYRSDSSTPLDPDEVI